MKKLSGIFSGLVSALKYLGVFVIILEGLELIVTKVKDKFPEVTGDANDAK